MYLCGLSFIKMEKNWVNCSYNEILNSYLLDCVADVKTGVSKLLKNHTKVMV